MLKVGNKIRFGHQIFIVECIKNNNILLNNNNILNWFSFDDIKKNCQKIQFNKPQNLSESFKNLNENVKNSLVFENDYVKIIARPIFETAYSNVYYHGSPVNNINKFKTPSFWSSDINFAEQYGKWVYIAQLDLSNCFDLSSKSHYEWLESKVGKIKYYDDMYNIHYYNSWMDFKNDDINFLDNWEITEQYLDIIKKSFNSVLLTEGGTSNVAILDNKLIHLIKKQPRNLDEGYVKRKSEFGNTGVMFDNDYIEFEEGMSYIDENNIKWTIVAINTDKDGEQICRVESEDGKTDIISSFILNIDIFDLDIKHPIYDERFFKKEDIAHTNQQNNINESSEIVIYTQNKIYRKIYECNKFDAISDFKKTFNYYNTLIPQYLKNNGFLEESLFYATQWKDEQGDDVFFTILKNPTKKEFNDLLKNSKNKQLRAIVGPHFNDDIYVWDAYYGTHDDIFRRYIYPVDKKFRDGFANVMFRKNDYDIWGFTFSDWFNKLGYNSKDNSTNTISKEKWEELYADDDLGLLDESNNLKYNQTIVSEEDKQEFLQILAKHRQLVNYYASKVGKNYPNHDLDKLKPDMFIPYVKGFVIGKQSLNSNEWKEFKNTQDKHYKQASHHSQFWDKSWTHDGQIPDVCGKMPDDAIIEMCADWCAMSKKYGNTPFEWADENIGKLWKFDEHQIQVIYDTLHKMWDSNNTIKESLQTIETIHTPIYITNNVYDVIKLTNKIPSMRVLIDTNKNLYIIGNSLFNIHNQLFDYAIQAGYYNFKNQREKDEYWENLPAILIDENDYFSFDRKNDYFDDMIICKNFVVYYRTDDFLDTKLYKLLIEKYNGKHQINEMRVYAGSPTQYEKPSLIAIGSGEGNQAHGWGLYYALDRKIGEKYAKTFSVNKKTYFKGQLIKWNDTGVYLGNKKINQKDNETLYNFFANVTSYTIPDYREELNYLIKDYELSLKHWNSMGNNNSQMLENIKKRIKQKKIQLKLLDYIKQEPSYVYTCDIPENGYLYEDRTLNQQFPSIKDKLYKINNIFNLEFEDTDTGQEIYSKMVYAFETSKKASMVLLKYGIKGITYVGEQDGRCFVIFNPKDVQVLDVKRFKLNEYFQNYGILYHGTDASFDNFNKDYQNGGYLGKGFYFTMNKSMAKSYGNNIIQAKLNYKNSFFFNVDTLSNNMIIEMLDTTQAQNYQKERILNLYHSLVNDNGFYDANSKLFDFVDTFNGDSTLILQKYGYDSIDNIDRDSEFVVFEPEQIQIIF